MHPPEVTKQPDSATAAWASRQTLQRARRVLARGATEDPVASARPRHLQIADVPPTRRAAATSAIDRGHRRQRASAARPPPPRRGGARWPTARDGRVSFCDRADVVAPRIPLLGGRPGGYRSRGLPQVPARDRRTADVLPALRVVLPQPRQARSSPGRGRSSTPPLAHGAPVVANGAAPSGAPVGDASPGVPGCWQAHPVPHDRDAYVERPPLLRPHRWPAGFDPLAGAHPARRSAAAQAAGLRRSRSMPEAHAPSAPRSR